MVELALTHDGRCWVARTEDLSFAGRELRDLDAEVAAHFGQPDRRVRIRMYCERGTVPEWMRPFAAHYFNREITIEPRTTDEVGVER